MTDVCERTDVCGIHIRQVDGYHNYTYDMNDTDDRDSADSQVCWFITFVK